MSGLQRGAVFEIDFFFQAEDGIRDWSVTGVQTCALPIFYEIPIGPEVVAGRFEIDWDFVNFAGLHPHLLCEAFAESSARSEERRVGKECRSRGSPDD